MDKVISQALHPYTALPPSLPSLTFRLDTVPDPYSFLDKLSGDYSTENT